MWDNIIAWMMAHPLQSVGLMALLGVAAGLLTPMSEASHLGHPRC